MRVIRRYGAFGTKIEIVGPGPAREHEAVALARTLNRPIGVDGGQRDPLPGNPRERYSRDRYVGGIAFPREVAAWIKTQADERGLSRCSFVGMVIEAVEKLTDMELDKMLSGGD